MSTTAARQAMANRFQPDLRRAQNKLPPSSTQVNTMVVRALVNISTPNWIPIHRISKTRCQTLFSLPQHIRLTPMPIIRRGAQTFGWLMAEKRVPSQ